jgi:hypothetical protein
MHDEPLAISADLGAAAPAEVGPSSDAAVEIAQIQADRDIAMEREYTKRTLASQQLELAELRGELSGVRQALDALQAPAIAAAAAGALAPEVEPEPVVVVEDPPPAEPEVDVLPVATPPPADEPTGSPEPGKRRGAGWFD